LLYFDHNATTPVAPEVAETTATALRETWGNASSIHTCGQAARQHIESSRRTIANYLGVSPAEFVFTSGGTESNNLAILGLVRSLPGERKHVVTTVVEHPSVLEPCRQLEREGVEVTYAAVNGDGVVGIEEIRRAVTPETVLISVMHANNETGTVQPLREIGSLVGERCAAGQPLYFHSDGVQALGKVDAPLREFGVHLYSISAHKIYAPKGVGGLYVAAHTPLRAVQFGGRHERERRAGTENVAGAMAFARAAELCSGEGDNRIEALRDAFEAHILSALDGVEVNGSITYRLPNTSNLLFRDVSGEAIVIALDMQGMAVSSGSACSSGSTEPSHVLLAMGRSRDEARSSVRFSFGRYNTMEDVEALSTAVVACVRRLRKPAVKEARLARV
jgi:cysteine desulfurase